MPYESNKAKLPPTELGDNRCLQIGYYGHGDIFMATWTGSLDLEPHLEDGISTCFNLAHGSDLILLASCVGYLRRLGKSEEQVRRVIMEAGRGVIEDDLGNMRFHSIGNWSSVHLVATGSPSSRFDRDGMRSLVIPTPAQPGTLERVGGTAIYTRPNPNGEDTLVYASLRPDRQSDFNVGIHETADFCSDDIPVIAGLVCEMALGEYRRDLRYFLEDETLFGEEA